MWPWPESLVGPMAFKDPPSLPIVVGTHTVQRCMAFINYLQLKQFKTTKSMKL